MLADGSTKRHLVRLLVAAGISFAAMSAWCAEQPSSTGKGKQAIGILAGFERAWSEARQRTPEYPGPATLKVTAHCDYGGFFCEKLDLSCNTHKFFKIYDFSYDLGGATNRMAYLYQAADMYRTAIDPLRTWNVTNLPEIRKAFEAAFRNIQEIENGADQLNPEQAKALSSKIASLQTALDGRIANLTSQIKALNNADEDVKSQMHFLERDVKDYRKSAEDTLDEAEGAINRFPCGKNGYPDEIQSRKSIFETHITALEKSAGRLSGIIGNMRTSVSLLQGTILNIQNQYSALSKSLSAILRDDSAFERERTLSKAGDSFKELSAYALKELGDGVVPAYVPDCAKYDTETHKCW